MKRLNQSLVRSIAAIGILILFVVFAVSSSLAVSAASVPKANLNSATYSEKQIFQNLFYFRDTKKGRESLWKNISSIHILAPQVYGVNGEGKLSGGLDPEIRALAIVNRVKVMPLVTNGSFSRSVMAKILEDEKVQDRIIASLVEEGKKQNYWGWQFDFEQIDAAYRDQFSRFVEKTAKQLKANNLAFSVAVIAQHSDNPADYKPGLWDKVIGVYDYQAIGQAADFVSLMSYDQPDSKGPVASYEWLEKVLDYSLARIPAEKLSMGVPFYYWKWDDVRGKIVDMGGYGRIEELLNSRTYRRLGWSEKHQTPWVEYKQKGKISTAWYENAKSFEKKFELARSRNLHGFSAWVLGLEDPAIHAVIKEK